MAFETTSTRRERILLGRVRHGGEFKRALLHNSTADLTALLEELEAKWKELESEEEEVQKKEKEELGEQIDKIKERLKEANNATHPEVQVGNKVRNRIDGKVATVTKVMAGGIEIETGRGDYPIAFTWDEVEEELQVV